MEKISAKKGLTIKQKRELTKDAMTISLGLVVATALMKRTKLVKRTHSITGAVLVATIIILYIQKQNSPNFGLFVE